MPRGSARASAVHVPSCWVCWQISGFCWERFACTRLQTTPERLCRFSLLCLAACEAALQLQLPKHSNDLQSWDVPDVGTLAATAAPAAAMQALSNGGAHDGDGATEGAPPAAAQREPAPYPDIFGEERCSTLGQDVVFIANDWHAGAACCPWLIDSARVLRLAAACTALFVHSP